MIVLGIREHRLINAVRDRDIARVNNLLKRGVDPNTKTPNGNTLLLLSILLSLYDNSNVYKQIVALFIQHNADINLPNNEQEYPVIMASHSKTTEITELLLNAGVNINIQDSEGQNALHMAIIYSHSNTVKTLIKAGIDVNAKDMYGKTPLHCAAEVGGISNMRTLLKSGADLYALDKYGFTPLTTFSSHAGKYEKYSEELIKMSFSSKRFKKEESKQSISTGYEYDV